MKQTTKRFISMAVTLLLLTVAFVVFIEFIRPLYEEIQQVRSEQQSRQDFVTRQNAAITQVKKLIADYRQEGELQQAVAPALPQSPSTAEILAQVNFLARENRLSLQSFAVTTPAVENISAGGKAAAKRGSLVKPTGLVTFQVKFISGYEDFKAFLKSLETNVRLMDVKTVTLQPVGKSTQDAYALEMSATAYYQAP